VRGDGFNRYNGADLCPGSVSRPKSVRAATVLDDAYRYQWDLDYGLTSSYPT
jgi:hypothetical protein